MVDVLGDSKSEVESSIPDVAMEDIEDGEPGPEPTPVAESDDEKSKTEPSVGSDSRHGSNPGEHRIIDLTYIQLLTLEQTEVPLPPGSPACSCQDGWLSPRMKFILHSTFTTGLHKKYPLIRDTISCC